MPHFFVKSENINNDIITITEQELLNHLVRALRVKIRENLSFFDENKIKYETKILEVSKEKVLAKIEKKYPSHRFLNLDIYLACSILKQDAFFELLDGVTQIGIKGIYPLYTDNCTVSKAQIENKTQKWQKISDEAVKQCERADFLKIFETNTLNNFDFSKFDKVIVFSEIEKNNTLKNIIKNHLNRQDKILVITGPEGGFSKEEFEFFKAKGFLSAKISNLILKAHTACVSGLSDIIYELSD